MRLFLMSILVLFSTISTLAQEIYSEPDFPSYLDSIVIYFDATQASGRGEELSNYTGDLYTHTGVKTSSGDWQYVIGSWGNNASQPKLINLENGLYKLEIGDIYDFYNINNSTVSVVQLNFVFRTPSASQQSEDLFVELFPPGIKLRIDEPAVLPFCPEINQPVDFSISTSNADNVSIYLDDQLYYTTTEEQFEFNLTVGETGYHSLIILADSPSFEAVSDTINFFARNTIEVSPLPDGIQTGINYIDDATVVLALYAPRKEFVYLTGDFNDWEFAPENNADWQFDSKYYMNLTPDSTIYWQTLTGLTAGQEYRFQYLVDGSLRIADPYADKILEHADNDIPKSVYPGLIAYPSNKTDYSVSVFETAQQPYNWEVTDFERPDKDNLIIYEMLVRDFVSTHSYQTIIDTLDYLQNLGINALELMPVMEFEFNSSWGYNTSFYFAPDKYYGTKNDLKKLIDECHKRGIAVILDIVLNHMYGRSSFVRLYSSGEYGPPTSDNPWFNVTSPNPIFSYGSDLNHESPQTQELVDRVNRYWLEEYNIDGYRFDFTKGFTNTPGDGGSYDASRIQILKRMANQIWDFDPDAYVILEHFAPDTEEKELTDAGMLVWGNINHDYNEATMGYSSNLSRISWKNHTGFTAPGIVGYMESHDEERLMFKNLEYGNSSGNYSVKNYQTALQRIKTAAAFFFPVPGPKMIWQFGELGYDYSIDYNGRTGEKPVRWDYLEDGARVNVFNVYKELINLKKTYKVFSTDDFSTTLTNFVKRIRLNDDEMNVVVIGNFGVNTARIIPAFQETGMWYDHFNADSIQVDDVNIEVFLEPGEFHLFTSKRIPFADPNIITDIRTDNSNPVTEYALFQNYPNPFNPRTHIKFSLPNPGIVKAVIYNSLGEEIYKLTDDYYSAGTHMLRWEAKDNNGNSVPSGIYLCNIRTGSFNQTIKLMLLK